jgi:hypothetical protein
VQGPGATESRMSISGPDLQVVALLLGIFACLSGALAALCCAAWMAAREWRAARLARRGQ